ncbi:hypothetical protein MNBD_GAMMA08-2705 [hydrothermal vent metagenome]|uniref:IrrE N-terminal-like domain-containing protein n=1 Tax=hydrothermal vent metagenome TaxID=652676 RepID=A0A3B0XHL4_9ZZZZ
MPVLTCADIHFSQLQQLLEKYNLIIQRVEDHQKIPGSWFGEPEAGIIQNKLYVRNDTPVHSALHESCHYVCMDEPRRKKLHTNVGGDYDEENAVCYLSILLSDFIDGFGRERMLRDMDEWGYTFRLGSSQAWFENDAEDAFEWLVLRGIILSDSRPSWLCHS